jgi:hypothetical protein
MLGVELITAHHKKYFVMKYYTETWILWINDVRNGKSKRIILGEWGGTDLAHLAQDQTLVR